ncbi:hypothetical protein JTE90_027590 [Oedothorax gibbosus]|uniref:Diuretic hormone class 2 n=1 Tax=Oedothorax gibbosus TaxID=931172 RepID=A0AAV6VMC4_9ARAC|nr:hypothetical protein JTE90_027590 [Oedothorax gibbosus]
MKIFCKSDIPRKMSPYSTIVLFLCMAAATLDCSWSYPSSSASQFRSKRSVDSEASEDLFRVLMRMAQDIVESDSPVHEKRGIDLGISRGYSGSQAAKHLMGLAAANFANGPGRRRRDTESQ